MKDFAEKIGTRIDVVCLSAGVVSYPDTILEDVKPVILSMPSIKSGSISSNPSVEIIDADFSAYEDAKYGVQTYGDTVAKNIVDEIGEIHEGKTLILGTEEFMYLPVQVANEMEDRGYTGIYSSSTTRSPVIEFNDSKYAVNHKITYCLPDGDERFAYNISGFDTIVIVVDPSMEASDYLGRDGLISALCFNTVKRIILIEQRK